MKKYKIGFDFWGLLLFLVIMLPNFIWMAIPAPNDILRVSSITPIIDTIGSIFQVIFILLMCILIRKDSAKIKFSKIIIGMIISVICYFIGWIFYYCGFTNSLIIVLLTIPPCLAFILYTIDRKNVLALISVIIFTICHIIYGFVNYII
ncbi:MAG: hypothetical protein IJV31_09645 [Clostridia bacterium]|nr:hypothetical protein [Clostridia bacterium]